MGFLDKAKAAASDLAAKADSALAGSGLGGPGAAGGGFDADKYFHDLGVLTYLETNARATDPADRIRVLAALQEMEARGAIRAFALHTGPGARRRHQPLRSRPRPRRRRPSRRRPSLRRRRRG